MNRDQSPDFPKTAVGYGIRDLAWTIILRLLSPAATLVALLWTTR